MFYILSIYFLLTFIIFSELSGEVELENLPLKREALRHIGLPIEVKAGFIGKVRLQVPVRQIRTASWVIAIEQLYLVAGPIRLDKVRSHIKILLKDKVISFFQLILPEKI